MEAANVGPEWASLPADVLLHIANDVCRSSGACLAETETLLRLVCQAWRLALRPGRLVPAKLWAWQPGLMDSQLAPHASRLEVLAPLPRPNTCPLPQLAQCSRLRVLRLAHVKASALPALGSLTSLQSLVASGADAGWLGWASPLLALRSLRLAGAPMRLQPEEGLDALLPLRSCLTAVAFTDCLLLTDAGVARLAPLRSLRRLATNWARLGQAGVDALAGALTQLASLDLRLQDGVTVDLLLNQSHVAAGGSLTARVSRAGASALLASAGALLPGVARLAVHHWEAGFLLTASPAFDRLRGLTFLSLPRIQLPGEAVRQLAACTALRELDAELSYSVRDEALLTWRMLCALTCLRLAANSSLTEDALAAVLSAMPLLQELDVSLAQVDAAAFAPLAHMPALRTLCLTSCILGGGQSLAAALRSATNLTALRVQDCGIQSLLCGAVSAALPHLARLRSLHLGLRRAPTRADAKALALACAGLTRLTALDIHFGTYATAAVPMQAWRQLSALTGLRSLHACTGVGWVEEALAVVVSAATALRRLTLTDSSRAAVGCGWLAALAGLSQLSRLELNSCAALDGRALQHLHVLTALTALEAFRCPSLAAGDTLQRLRSALPCLASLSVHG